MKILKNHFYQVTYKNQAVVNYGWKNPLDKKSWVLLPISDNKLDNFCPLPDNYLKELVNDSEVEITDLGAF